MIRHAIAAATLLLANPATAGQTPAAEVAAENSEAAAMRSAFHFAFPLYTMARTRSQMPGINTLNYRTTLADEKSRDVTTPNNDTLYASGFLDLAAGPVILTLPPIAGRYHSVAIMNMATDNLAILGTRTGSQGSRYALMTTDYAGPVPAGAVPLRLACRDCWLLARVIVNGPEDLPAASEALRAITIEAPTTNLTAFASSTPARPDGAAFVAAVKEVIDRAGPSSRLAQQAASFPALDADPAKWSNALIPLTLELRRGLADAGDLVSGWSFPKFGIGNAEDDHLLRAQIAVSGLGALPRVEAMYISARSDSAGQPLSGTKAYTLRLPYNMPIGGFWSLTMYTQEPDGRLFFVGNALNRFAVGDRSKHLRAERDGSTDIFIQTSRPEGERVVNWLPAPAGPFVLVFRGYLPKAEMLDGSFRLPPVTESERIP
jgi:hypothetical protein